MSSDDLQQIPARHGTATFVPKGSTIKIVNSSGTQVIDTWVFALPDPPKSLKGGSEEEKQAEQDDEKKEDKKEEAKKQEQPPKQEKKPAESPNTKKGRKSKDDMGLPTQEEAEAATTKGISAEEQNSAQNTPRKAGWSSYLPSLRGSGKKQQQQPKQDGPPPAEDSKELEVSDKAQQKANSRTWGSYLSTGEGFTSYLPSKGAISAFATSHQRDTNKSYAEQLADFSKTPVGAASLSALTGSGTASSLYAGYSVWNAGNRNHPSMEYLSLPHTRAATCHLIPRVDDVLVSNLRQPLCVLVEDTSKGKHDTLMAACDPQRFKELGVEDWEEHGSCAENLVLALKEINDRAGLKGAKGIGADITINSVPGPLNLFMNVPWQGDKGELKFAAPEGKEGEYVRFRAERDIVFVMSACPQDITEINGKDKLPQDGHFLVETPDDDSSDDDADAKKALQKTSEKKKPKGTPKKLGSSAAGSKRPSVQVEKKPEEVPLPDDGKDAKAEKKDAPKPAEKKDAPKPAETKDAPKPAETKKPSGAAPTPAASTPAAAKPKAKPKKLVDPSTGEKKKPRKLESRAKPSEPFEPSDSGGAEEETGAGGGNENGVNIDDKEEEKDGVIAHDIHDKDMESKDEDAGLGDEKIIRGSDWVGRALLGPVGLLLMGLERRGADIGL